MMPLDFDCWPDEAETEAHRKAVVARELAKMPPMRSAEKHDWRTYEWEPVCRFVSADGTPASVWRCNANPRLERVDYVSEGRLVSDWYVDGESMSGREMAEAELAKREAASYVFPLITGSALLHKIKSG